MRIRREAITLVAVALVVALVVPGAAQANTVGKAASNFTLQTHDGKKLTLSSLKGKRGVVLVFFATWCPPCMAEVPHVKKFVESTRDRNVLVYGINIRQPKRVVQRFVRDRAVNYGILLDSDANVAKAYGVTGIPTIIGIDAEGLVRYRAHSLPRKAEALIKTLTAPLAKAEHQKPKKGPTDMAKAKKEPRDYVRDGVSFISKGTLQKWMKAKDKPLVIDVLSAASYKTGHIKGAINIPLSELKQRAAELDKNRKTVVYCANYRCGASTAAAKLLAGLGFRDVHDYKGGIQEWRQAGVPVEGGPKKLAPLPAS